MDRGFCVWLTGLSGSGKTTLSRLLAEALSERGLKVEVLDGEAVRGDLSPDLGFSRADRERHLRRLVFISRLLVRNGVAVVVAAVSPDQGLRAEARERLGDFVEVYLNCPLEVCRKRDPKGLYWRAQAGEVSRVAGLNYPYQAPQGPEVEVRTGEEDPAESLARVVRTLEVLGYVLPPPGEDYSPEEAEIVKGRLDDLGYL